MKKRIIILFLFIIFPFVVYADCESDFKKVENDFKVSYKYNKDTDDFDITFINPDYEKYTFAYHSQDEIKKFTITQDGKKETLLLRGQKDTKYTYSFIAKYDGCAYKPVTTKELELKKYNPYSDSELCKGNEEFVLCQREYDKALDEETFKSRLDSYIKSKNKSENSSNTIVNNNIKDNETQDNKSNFITNILKYIQEHIAIVIIISIVVIALIIGIVAYVKKTIKSRRLE